MERTRVARSLVIALVCCAALAGCSSGSSASGNSASPSVTPSASASALTSAPEESAEPSPTAPETITLVTALGDSVPRGTACNCTPFPELSAAHLGTLQSTSVSTSNESVAGLQTAGVVKQLTSNKGIRDAVRKATIIEVEIGANDVPYTSKCDTNYACYEPKFDGIQANLATIVKQIEALNAVHAHLVLLDYWSAWLGGKYAAERGQAYVDTAAKVTDTLNTIIREQAAKSDAIYVDLRAAFKGPNYTYDETHYLAPDGDHPNAAGHQKIADATVTAIRARWDI